MYGQPMYIWVAYACRYTHTGLVHYMYGIEHKLESVVLKNVHPQHHNLSILLTDLA